MKVRADAPSIMSGLLAPAAAAAAAGSKRNSSSKQRKNSRSSEEDFRFHSLMPDFVLYSFSSPSASRAEAATPVPGCRVELDEGGDGLLVTMGFKGGRRDGAFRARTEKEAKRWRSLFRVPSSGFFANLYQRTLRGRACSGNLNFRTHIRDLASWFFSNSWPKTTNHQAGLLRNILNLSPYAYLPMLLSYFAN